jgi:hypothetical protein
MSEIEKPLIEMRPLIEMPPIDMALIEVRPLIEMSMVEVAGAWSFIEVPLIEVAWIWRKACGSGRRTPRRCGSLLLDSPRPDVSMPGRLGIVGLAHGRVTD